MSRQQFVSEFITRGMIQPWTRKRCEKLPDDTPTQLEIQYGCFVVIRTVSISLRACNQGTSELVELKRWQDAVGGD